MDPTPPPGVAGENPATQGAVPVDRVLVVRVNEAPPERSDTVKKPDEKTGKALEWTKAIGMPIVTLVITILGGYFFTTLTNDRDSRESKDRLYAQLLTQREQSDALIRKDMFGVVINRFLTEAKPTDWSTKVLQLELLANNFNQSLDLAPLFKDLGRKLMEGPAVDGQRAELKKRLDRTAANLIFKQVNSLARRGVVIGKAVALSDWEKSFGTPFIDAAVPKARLVNAAAYTPTKGEEMIGFSVEVVGVSVERREVEVRLRVNLPDADDQDVDRHFWVGQYDFPMLDNTQLPHGLRTSVVITDFFVPDTPDERDANSFVQFYLVVFPAAGASFKERQDYDDILGEMLRARDGIRRQKERH